MKKTPEPFIDLATAIPAFEPLKRTTVRLHPRHGTPDSSSSHMGGTMLWPENTPWPKCPEHHCDLVPLLQINASDVPEMVFPKGKDVFQLLWCPNDHETLKPYYTPWAKILWHNSKDLTTPPPISTELNDPSYMPNPCTLDFERVVEYPSAFEELDELWEDLKNSDALANAVAQLNLKEIEETSTAYQYLLSVADGCKIGGYPDWIQDPEWPICECGKEMDYLLTITSAEFDGGTWHRWLPEDERHTWGASYDERNKVQRALDLMLGDMGNINYFICRNCDNWPIAWVFQCS